MSPQDERRTFTRIHVRVDAEVRAGSTQILSNRTRDLSFNGVYVYSPSPLPPGASCRITLHGAGGAVPVVLRVEGRVAHTDEQGMGVEFVTPLDDESVTNLRNLMLLNAPEPDTIESEFYAHVTRPVAPRDLT